MNEPKFDFYDKTNLKSYNLDKNMRYQLNLLDSLDVFTRKHCENVAALTCNLCEYLHCSKDFTEYCTICAYLHDIGKLFIPPAILQKPGKLTEEEYAKMKTHTTLGYNLCMKDLKLRPYSAGALYHHEALNGSGYPQGLKKKDIPYEGQIIRVADEYDAIVSKRQYKSHIGISDTLKILIENSKPSENLNSSAALSEITLDAKLGKNNPVIVRTLFKVVIDDIYYEISCRQDYINTLEEELKRFKEIKWSERFKIKTWPAKHNSVFSIRNYEVYNEAGEKVAIASTKWVLMDINTKKLVRDISDVAEKYVEYDKMLFEEDFPKLKEPSDIEYTYKHIVQKRDIDTNGHINNVKYLEIAYEALPDDVYENAKFKNIDIMYKHSAFLGEEMRIGVDQNIVNGKEEYTIVMKSNDKLNAIIRLS